MEETKVILVDDNDNEIGFISKTEAHQKAVLHRAISVFVVNSAGEWLIQQRAIEKYHSAGLWTNTCCSHPLPGETNAIAATRRLQEEMGIENCMLTRLFNFTYLEELENGLTEHELDHVYLGFSDQLPNMNAEEVMSFRYITFDELKSDVAKNPDAFTVWFRRIFERVQQHIETLQN